MKMFHEGRLFEFKIIQNTETVKKKKTQGFRKQTFTHYTKRERPWHKPLLWQEGIHETHLPSKYELNRFSPLKVIGNVSLFLLSH